MSATVLGDISASNSAANAAASAVAAAASATLAASFTGLTAQYNTVALLAAHDMTGQSSGEAYVTSLHWMYWYDKTGGGSADGIYRVAATGGGFWVRDNKPNLASIASLAGAYVNFSTGNDETGDGTIGSPLKTCREHAFRTNGAVLSSTRLVVIQGDMDSGDVAYWNYTPAGGQFQIIFQMGSAFYSGTITSALTTAVTADLPNTGVRYKFADSAIPVSITASGILAKGVLIQFTHSAAQANCFAWSDLGTKTLQISIPTNMTCGTANSPINIGDQPANGGADVVLTSGDAYACYQMPKMYNLNWNPLLNVCVQNADVQSSNGHPASWSRRTYWKNCSFDGFTVRGASVLANCRGAANGGTDVAITDVSVHPGAADLARHIMGGMYAVVRPECAIAMQSGLSGTVTAFICNGILINSGGVWTNVACYFYDYSGPSSIFLYDDSTLALVKSGGAGNTCPFLFAAAAKFRHGGLSSLPGSGITSNATMLTLDSSNYTFAQVTTANARYGNIGDATIPTFGSVVVAGM